MTGNYFFGWWPTFCSPYVHKSKNLDSKFNLSYTIGFLEFTKIRLHQISLIIECFPRVRRAHTNFPNMFILLNIQWQNCSIFNNSCNIISSKHYKKPLWCTLYSSSRAFQRYQKCGEGHGGLGDLNIMTIELPSLIDRCLQILFLKCPNYLTEKALKIKWIEISLVLKSCIKHVLTIKPQES